MRKRRLNIGVRLEINFDDGNPVERLRFGVLNVVDQRGDSAFNVAGNALFHFLRLKSGEGPDKTDHGNIDVGENICGRAHQDKRRQQYDDQGHHDKRIRPL